MQTDCMPHDVGQDTLTMTMTMKRHSTKDEKTKGKKTI